VIGEKYPTQSRQTIRRRANPPPNLSLPTFLAAIYNNVFIVVDQSPCLME
jgi:hypothetical protein